jgi:hypothetical protein
MDELVEFTTGRTCRDEPSEVTIIARAAMEG